MPSARRERAPRQRANGGGRRRCWQSPEAPVTICDRHSSAEAQHAPLTPHSLCTPPIADACYIPEWITAVVRRQRAVSFIIWYVVIVMEWHFGSAT